MRVCRAGYFCWWPILLYSRVGNKLRVVNHSRSGAAVCRLDSRYLRGLFAYVGRRVPVAVRGNSEFCCHSRWLISSSIRVSSPFEVPHCLRWSALLAYSLDWKCSVNVKTSSNWMCLWIVIRVKINVRYFWISVIRVIRETLSSW